MSDKKSIDRLFQEKLKDFEATPSSSVWENIAEQIGTSSSQRKAIPVWWKIAGVAASIILLFSIGNMLFNNEKIIPEENVVNTNPDSEKTNQKNSNQNDTNNLDVVDDASNNTSNSELVQGENSNSEDILVNNSKKSNPVAKNNTSDQTIVAATEKRANKQKSDAPLINGSLLKQEVNNTIAQNISSLDADALQKASQEKAIEEKPVNSTFEELNKSEKSQNTKVAVNTDPKKEMTTDNVSSVTKVEGDGLSITEVLVAKNEDNLDDDSNEKADKWRIAPNIAPVYFNTLGTGSSIHGQFNNNNKTGDVNMSYGVSASYAITDKLSVRTGVHKVNLGYSTNDIVVYNNIQTIPNSNPLLRNISFNEASQSVSFISVDEFNFGQVPGVLSNRINASIDQKLGFLEIPLELQYNFTDNKFGISVIGGVSALFLNNNEIYSVQDGKTTLLGKATNVNNMSYSANLGLGLDYKISKKINFNLEPIFKYQLNTFSNTSGNFKPYFIGVYTGFSFKF